MQSKSTSQKKQSQSSQNIALATFDQLFVGPAGDGGLIEAGVEAAARSKDIQHIGSSTAKMVKNIAANNHNASVSPHKVTDSIMDIGNNFGSLHDFTKGVHDVAKHGTNLLSTSGMFAAKVGDLHDAAKAVGHLANIVTNLLSS
ncbi:MAG: hypothetical protein GY782_03375 [Gammaproteobacteria bacterium]|nr:hypothetical protein [Gammaproteobacteria bacterium]